MTITTGPAHRGWAPMWSRGPRILEFAALTVIGLATTVELITVAQTSNSTGGYIGLTLTAAGVILGVRRPQMGLGAIAAGPLAAALLGWNPIADWNIACFAAFVFALRGMPGLLTGIVLGTANLAAAGLAAGTIVPAENPAASIAASATLVGAAVGSSIRGHHQYRYELEQRTREAIATREEAVNRSVAEERLRIARDLHDSVGHKIAVVSMHLGAAQVHLPENADDARADLTQARASVQAVLRETQQILHVLRVGGTPLAPTPPHGRIPELVDSYLAAGVKIEATLPDLTLPLAPNVSTAAFRITQEALTNAQRHGTGEVTLRIDVDEQGTVIIEVVNVCRSGKSQNPSTYGGHGLAGMRERAASTGGSLDVRADERLFWIRAELPASQEEDL